MSRLDCLNGAQHLLVVDALRRCGGVNALAKLCRVHPRTIRDWRREKHRMSFEAFQQVRNKFGVLLPPNARVLPEYWHIPEAARKGGKRRHLLYGAFTLGSRESRRRGGLTTIRRFQKDPSLARGFRLRKAIQQPRKSVLLSELIGIVLGDGCLSNPFQVGISFNSESDAEYGLYLQKLFAKLFGITATIQLCPGTKGGCVVASSRALVEYLQKLGLSNGNKVALQVGVPDWIWARADYQRACLRGLMDTDGSIYGYTHRVYGHTYRHHALCFTNRSRPLLTAVTRFLAWQGFQPRVRPFQVYLNRRQEIIRYFRIVGSSNSKHLLRFKYALREMKKIGEVRELVDSAGLENR